MLKTNDVTHGKQGCFKTNDVTHGKQGCFKTNDETHGKQGGFEYLFWRGAHVLQHKN